MADWSEFNKELEEALEAERDSAADLERWAGRAILAIALMLIVVLAT